MMLQPITPMVHVRRESPKEIHTRLRSVLARAQVERLPGAWCFAESRAEATTLDPRALALIRDGAVVSQVVPTRVPASAERFAVFAIHFPAHEDNSGFVGWLATELKAALGTGVAVVCGSNQERGGVYDYWLLPEALGDAALEIVGRLAR